MREEEKKMYQDFPRLSIEARTGMESVACEKRLKRDGGRSRKEGKRKRNR